MNRLEHRIRRLGATDVDILRPVRLDALRLHPQAYGSSHEEESLVPRDDLARRLLLPPATMFGGFAGDTLAGITGLRVETRIKSRHKAHVFSVYVDAAHRRTGLGRALVETAIAHARDGGIRLLLLTVTVGNDAARQAYAGLGFRSYGIEQRALLVNGVFCDTEYMALELD
ncbi:MAG TPA: GNAT family N-acetyltransferase [Acetobacteraceae bacterium]|nr:GNAT family N-acetyltransferase [Acetobacteraceae bacterium]